ncbi:MAG TPA: GldG family protein [Thermoanaerobaculia bacterium]|nr:GldG family protein [Thermoanaerobaculia bacterium]
MTTMDQANRRQLVRTGTLSAGVLLLAALLLIVNYFGWKYYKRFDWTGSQLYSLSEKTVNVLKGLKHDVDFYVFLSPDEQHELYQPTSEVLARYGAVSRRVHVHIVDTAKNPIEAQQLIQKFGVTSTGVVVASGNDRRVVDSNDLAELDFRSMQSTGRPQMTGYKGEQLFTSAILQLSEGHKPKILFTTGHGEHSLDDQGGHGLSGARQLLGRDNFELSEWSSLGQAAVPAGTDLLVVAGPSGSFVKPELDAFSSYLTGGGRMLVMLDPTLIPGGSAGLVQTGLEAWLATYGLKAGQDIVVDPSNPLPFFGPETIFSKNYGEHPITKALAESNQPVLLTLSRSVSKGSSPGLKVTELMRTSTEGWGETNLANLQKVSKDAQDLAGPVPLAAAVETDPAQVGKKGLRLVAVGDSDFATNQLLQANVANTVLLSNAFNWLVEREALLGIPPKKTEQVKLTLTGDEFRHVWLLAAALPLLSAILGGYIFFRRRR